MMPDYIDSLNRYDEELLDNLGLHILIRDGWLSVIARLRQRGVIEMEDDGPFRLNSLFVMKKDYVCKPYKKGTVVQYLGGMYGTHLFHKHAVPVGVDIMYLSDIFVEEYLTANSAA